MRKIYVFFILLVLVVSVTYASPLTFFWRNRVEKEILILEDTQQFPVLELVDFDGDPIAFNTTEKYKLVFSLSSTCSYCITLLDMIERLCYFYDSSDILIYNIWNDKIPMVKVEKLMIPEEINLCLTGEKKLTLMTPDCILLDQNNNITFKANTGFSALVMEKICDLFGKPNEEAVLDYLKTKFALPETGKLPLFFSIDQCGGCEEEKAKIASYTANNSILANMLVISRDTQHNLRNLADEGNLLSKTLGIQRYPHYIVFDLQTGERTDYRKLEDVVEYLNLQ